MSDISERADQLSTTKRTLLVLKEVQARLDALERERTEPIAIIGIGCRFPGGANDPEAFWEVLRQGRDAISEMPIHHWSRRSQAEGAPALPETERQAYWGGFLAGVDQFDAAFFGISPREATQMDPQQRLVLEVAWEALERAGLPAERLVGSRTGVFVGATTSEYGQLLQQQGIEHLDAYYATGNTLNALAGRLSYLLGLQGPSLAVDTACSSSLVAVHLACQSLRLGECDLALAGGVNLILSPLSMISASNMKMMAADGRCKTFDARADGYVRGEGCGMVVLKRLSAAQAAGDPILALIRGSAVNQDGASSGFTVPNGPAQQQVLTQALRQAGLRPAEVDYVEAHGTGTALGDPIEVQALGKVMSQGREREQPLLLGSVKTNVGHLEAAAGMAGLLKVVLALQNGYLPAHLHLRELNPLLDLEEIPAEVVREARPWPERGHTKTAGVSAFGVSGTNAHIIVQEAPESRKEEAARTGIVTTEAEEERVWLLPLSARSPEALRALVRQWVPFLRSQPASRLPDLCFTASQRRTHHPFRLALVGRTPADLASQAQSLLEQPLPTASPRSGQPAALVLVFPGQGSQWVGMGRHLLAHSPLFRHHLQRCEQALRPFVDWSLLSLLREPAAAEQMQEIAVIQPVLFAMQVSLASLWLAWGLQPAAVVGHSMGEVAAAVVAGILSLEEGARVICRRSQLLSRLRGQGAMMLVERSQEQVEELLSRKPGSGIGLAASNSSRASVLSGPREALAALGEDCSRRGIFWRWVQVDVASHSPQVEPLKQELGEALRGLRPQEGKLSFYSTVEARRCRGEELDAAYWGRNLREPVRFAEVVRLLLAQAPAVFLEISPHPILLPSIEQELDDAKNKGSVFPSCVKQEEEATLLATLGALYTQGYPLEWQQILPSGGRCVALPAYPWQHQRYWVETTPLQLDASTRLLQASLAGSVPHPFPGRRLRSALKEIIFETVFSPASPAYLNDHRIKGTLQAPVVVPGSSHTSMALSAARAAFAEGLCTLQEVYFLDALVLPEDGAKVLQIILSPQEKGAATFQIFSAERQQSDLSEEWVLHASGKIRTETSTPSVLPLVPEEIQARCQDRLKGSDFYRDFWQVGYQLGPGFCWMEQIWRGEGEALCLMRLPGEADQADRYEIPPGLLDSCFQLLSVSHGAHQISDFLARDDIYVPVSIEQVRLYTRPAGQLWAHAERREGDLAHKEVVGGNIRLYKQNREICAEILGLRVKSVNRRVLLRLVEPDIQSWLYEWAWQHCSRPFIEPAQQKQVESWLILADCGGTGARLAERLRQQGKKCLVVYPGTASVQLAQDEWELDLPHLEEHTALFQNLLSASESSLRGIVHLWSLDALVPQDEQALTANDLMERQHAVCHSVLFLVQALGHLQSSGETRLWLLTRGTQEVEQIVDPRAVASTPLWGLGRTIANEYPELRCVLLDLDPEEPENWLDDVLAELRAADDSENQLSLRGHERYCARLIQSAALSTASSGGSESSVDQPCRLEISERGTLENLCWRPFTRRPPGAHEVEIQVRATGLNFRDVLNALGMYPGDAGAFGGECAGTIVAVGEQVDGLHVGDDVLAIFAPLGTFSTLITVQDSFVVPKPAHLSFAEAATLPMTFLTAYYGLHTLARMAPGDRVLIHAAAGGVGLAAIQLAQLAGAQVFATASPDKQAFLRELGVRYIANSRSLEFAHDLRQQSQGQSVDIVLNSLSGPAIPESLSLLAPQGRFIEIGKRDTWSAQQVAEVRPDIAFASFDLVRLAQEEPDRIRSVLRILMAMAVEKQITPLPLTSFSQQEVLPAFRLMAQGRHVGKIVVTYPQAMPAQESSSRQLFSEQKSYLITGGAGGLGLAVAGWMVEHGARHLALLGRRQPAASVQAELKRLENAGVVVVFFQADVAREERMREVLSLLHQQMPPLRGIIHAAGVLDDGTLHQQTWERFRKVLAPKVAGAWNLHLLTRHLPLDFFVLFSSAASLLGSAGQSNHAAANAFLDGLALYRRSQQLPVTSICWGGWSEIGAAASSDLTRQHEIQGMGSIAPEQGLRLLEMILAHPLPLLGVLPIHWPRYLSRIPAGQEPALLRDLVQAFRPQARATHESATSTFLSLLSSAHSSQRYDLLFEHVREQVIRIFRGNASFRLDPQRPLREQGLDSLMAVELRNMLRATTGLPLPATLLYDYPDVQAIARHLDELLGHDTTPAATMPDQQIRETLTQIEQLSDEEVDLFLEEMADRVMKHNKS
jgi:acyl transferase domain-containing protein/acyl carrier protein